MLCLDYFSSMKCESIIGVLSFYQFNWYGVSILGQNLLAIQDNWAKTERLNLIIISLDKTWFCMLWKIITSQEDEYVIENS